MQKRNIAFEGNTIRFRTYHVIDSFAKEIGKVTVCSALHPKIPELRYISFSFCSKEEIYDKILGQLISAGRIGIEGKRVVCEKSKIKEAIKLWAKDKNIKWFINAVNLV